MHLPSALARRAKTAASPRLRGPVHLAPYPASAPLGPSSPGMRPLASLLCSTACLLPPFIFFKFLFLYLYFAGCRHSLVAVALLWLMGSVALRCMESSPIRDWTHIPCTGRRILSPWTTGEIPRHCLFEDLIDPPKLLHLAFRASFVFPLHMPLCASNSEIYGFHQLQTKTCYASRKSKWFLMEVILQNRMSPYETAFYSLIVHPTVRTEELKYNNT